MVDSTLLGDVVDECAAGAAELVVEADAGGEAEEALQDPFAQAGGGGAAVAFEGEYVFAGPEDLLDPLADRGEVWPLARLVFAPGTDDRGVESGDFLGEVAAGVAFVAEDRLAAAALAEFEQFEADLAFVAFGRGELERTRGAVARKEGVQPEAPEKAAVGGAVAVVGRV